MEASIKRLSVPLPGSLPLKFSTLYSEDAFSQFLICFQKQNLVYWRNPEYNAVRILFTLAMSLIIGTVYWNIGAIRFMLIFTLVDVGRAISLCVSQQAWKDKLINLSILRDTTTQNLFAVLGALYSTCVFLGIGNASSVQPVISIERTVFYRERAAGMYSPYPYALAQASCTRIKHIKKNQTCRKFR